MAIFSGCTALILVSMTVWGVARPTVERKSFLPIVTTRDGRLFVDLLTAAYINLAWVGLTPEKASVWGDFIASMVALIIATWCG